MRARIARPPTGRSDFCVWSVRGASRRATPAARMIAVTSCSAPGPCASGSLVRACVPGAYSILCVTEMTQDRHESSVARLELPVSRDVFERDGFVVVPGLFDEREIARISVWTDELERAPEVPGRAMKYYEPSLLRPGERVLQRIENFCPFHAGFGELCDSDKLRGSVGRLLGEPAVLFKDKINFK